MKTARYILASIAIAGTIDIMILLITMLQIGHGIDTPHIPFWDAQIRVLATILK